jgi:hypothetical protein
MGEDALNRVPLSTLRPVAKWWSLRHKLLPRHIVTEAPSHARSPPENGKGGVRPVRRMISEVAPDPFAERSVRWLEGMRGQRQAAYRVIPW